MQYLKRRLFLGASMVFFSISAAAADSDTQPSQPAQTPPGQAAPTEFAANDGAVQLAANGGVYYARVLEIATPRWTTLLAIKNNLPLPDNGRPTPLERAWRRLFGTRPRSVPSAGAWTLERGPEEVI